VADEGRKGKQGRGNSAGELHQQIKENFKHQNSKKTIDVSDSLFNISSKDMLLRFVATKKECKGHEEQKSIHQNSIIRFFDAC
jgi:hypothetical protein